jgi:NAD(P)-dependent dehydrogenase (short-subunit alcohol dehydrogenase family)
MSGRVEGKRAITIGTGQGFGATSARMLAAEGARVVVADIEGDKAERVAEEIRAAGGDAEARWVDIGDEDAVRTLVEDAASWLGGVDVLFSNAAILASPAVNDDALKPVAEIATDVWDTTMRVNVRGPWLAAKYAIPHMVAAGGGSIVYTASLAALMAMPVSGAYSVSKAGVNALALVIATQYGRQGIRCNAINPGTIETRHLQEDYYGVMERHNLVPRLGRGEDIGALVVYLASDESGYVTGQNLVIDGGFSVHVPTWAEMSAPDAPTPKT